MAERTKTATRTRRRKPARTPRVTNPPQPFSDEEMKHLRTHHECCGNDCPTARWIETLAAVEASNGG